MPHEEISLKVYEKNQSIGSTTVKGVEPSFESPETETITLNRRVKGQLLAASAPKGRYRSGSLVELIKTTRYGAISETILFIRPWEKERLGKELDHIDKDPILNNLIE